MDMGVNGWMGRRVDGWAVGCWEDEWMDKCMEGRMGRDEWGMGRWTGHGGVNGRAGGLAAGLSATSWLFAS